MGRDQRETSRAKEGRCKRTERLDEDVGTSRAESRKDVAHSIGVSVCHHDVPIPFRSEKRRGKERKQSALLSALSSLSLHPRVILLTRKE